MRVPTLKTALLTHGFIENRRIWDLDAEHSLARATPRRRVDPRSFDPLLESLRKVVWIPGA